MSEQNWSAQQLAIFEWFKSGSGNLVVEARAGVGKTTTIIRAIDFAPETRILLAAFNKRIADELALKLTNVRAEAKTLHAVGFKCVLRYWERMRLDDKRRGQELTEAACAGRIIPDPIKRLITKLHGKGREVLPLARRGADLLDLAEMFECVPDEEWEAEGFDARLVADCAYTAMELAAASKPQAIDFADMVYLPIRNKWLVPTYDLVVVDEAQDMGMAQLLIAQGVVRPGGRIAVVGDSRQGIYGFRGASTDALDNLRRELKATELGLTTTYRCGKVITRRAAGLVPDFDHGPNNPEGKILRLSSIEQMVKVATPGDFVLSRKNAPLAQVAMALIRAQIRTVIAGRDIGAGLVALVNKLTEGRNSIPAFLEKLSNWEEKETKRAEKADKDDRIPAIHDKAETLKMLAEDVAGVAELRARILCLFDDNGQAAVVCSSVHKAKGLEADRVFLLEDTFYPPAPCSGCNHFHGYGSSDGACQRCACKAHVPVSAQRLLEEENIEYVAITRAKSTLVLVGPSRRGGVEIGGEA